jgi:hypothetical protein
MYEFVVSYIACCLPVFRACDHALTEIFQLELFGPVITHFRECSVTKILVVRWKLYELVLIKLLKSRKNMSDKGVRASPLVHGELDAPSGAVQGPRRLQAQSNFFSPP